jgi:carotenoid cleavage dioxygenase-like enzyme
MIHEFPITKRSVIFPLNPIEFNPFNFIKGRFVFHFNSHKPSRYGVMSRYNTDLASITWFNLPAHVIFHYINAWEE